MILSATPSTWDYLDTMFSLVALAGFFAYAYKKKLLSAKFWKFWLVIFILWDLTYNLIISYHLGLAQQLGPDHRAATLNEMLFGLVFLIPEYVALYLLGFKSQGIWNKSS